MKRISLVTCLLAIWAGSLFAQTGFDEIREDINLAGGGYSAYPFPKHPLPKLTPAPKGYKPFYISHYGRHGSRWLHAASQYDIPIQQMDIAKRYGKLTPRGEQVLAQLRKIRQDVDGRIGELTPKGALQHQQIAQRMTHNFPEVFSGDAIVDCRSSVVMRCALSMLNEVKELQGFNPKMKITTDASNADMWYMVTGDSHANELEARANANELKDFRHRHTHPDHVMSQLFNDMQFVKDSIDVNAFYGNFSDLTSNQQSTDTDVSFWDLFDEQEIQDHWLQENAFWYVVRGPSPISEGFMPTLARLLLRNIVQTADSIIATGQHGANLRFGHDANLMPLAVLMELGNCGMIVNDLEDLAASGWMMHHITPMAGNMQLIFYRNKKKPADVLVKALLCEREVSLPVQTDQYPYYRWSDVRDYYLRKIAN